MKHSINLTQAWKLVEQQSGSLRAVRSFNCPTGLTAQQNIGLRIELSDGVKLLSWQLNHMQLETCIQGTIPGIGLLLQPHNQLQVHLQLVREADHSTLNQLEKRVINMSPWFCLNLEID